MGPGYEATFTQTFTREAAVETIYTVREFIGTIQFDSGMLIAPNNMLVYRSS